ncbi:hypothetical protein [Cryptosporangium sp. NPDC051539]|uniref:hypothetical protein n=1 Tax=Cryptosporangium sp. NPDC051539 TaxID=3363962 RepID=UPI0037A40B27
MGRYTQALDESQHGIEPDFAETPLDPGDVRLREPDEFGDHVLPPDRRARPVELRDPSEVVIGECRPHFGLGPEIEGQHRSEQLDRVCAA